MSYYRVIAMVQNEAKYNRSLKRWDLPPGSKPTAKMGVLGEDGKPSIKPLNDGGEEYSKKEKAKMLKSEENRRKNEEMQRIRSKFAATKKEKLDAAREILKEAKDYPDSDARSYLKAAEDAISGRDPGNDYTRFNKPGTPVPDWALPDDLWGSIQISVEKKGKVYDPEGKDSFTFKWDGKKLVPNK